MDQNGVSTVVAVILMVAVTVIMAAIIGAYVFGSVDLDTKRPTFIYVTVEKISSGILVQYMTSPADPQVTVEYLRISSPNGNVTWNDPAVGTTKYLYGTSSGRTVVVAKYSNGVEQIVYDQVI